MSWDQPPPPPPRPPPGIDPAAPRRPRIATGAWQKLAVSGVAALVAALLVPHADTSGDMPSAITLLLPGLVVGVIVTAGFLLVLTSDLNVPRRTIALAGAYMILIALVKFVLAPTAVYEVNQNQPLTDIGFAITNPLGAGVAAVIVFLLYAAVWGFMYRFIKKRALARRRTPEERDRLIRRIVFVVVGGTIILAMAGATGVVFLPLLVLSGGAEYLDFVFTSSLSLLIAVSLAWAIGFAGQSLKSVSDRAMVVADASLFVSFFWVGLAFLALYHVLWVVYILVLTSIWPLKTVVPK